MKNTNICAGLLAVMLVLTLCLTACSLFPNPGPSPDGGGPSGEVHDAHKCAYCGKCVDSTCTSCMQKCACEPLQITHTTWKILEDTPSETTVHLFQTNKPGPGIAIVGGIHGDELAGWNEGLALVNENSDSYVGKLYGVCGNILIIPQANILADNAKQRWYDMDDPLSDYSDLNRSFLLGRNKKATQKTIEISTAIQKTVEDFDKQYGAKFIIDLHEATRSYTLQTDEVSTLGDTLIWENCPEFNPFAMDAILDRYNSVYRPESEPEFASQLACQKGSFNYYFTKTYTDKVVFTVETNRNYDKNALSVRVRQQHNVLCAMFDVAWGYDE